MSQRLTAMLRESDRWRVSEATNSSSCFMKRSASRIRRVARDHGRHDGAVRCSTGRSTTSASIGIAVFPHDGVDGDVLRSADTAMYHAKREGPIASPTIEGRNEIVTRRLDIENGLQEAIVNNSVRVHFQPQVDVGLGDRTGAEALLRWRHPERGMVPPASSFPTQRKRADDTRRSLGAAGRLRARRRWTQPHGRSRGP